MRKYSYGFPRRSKTRTTSLACACFFHACTSITQFSVGEQAQPVLKMHSMFAVLIRATTQTVQAFIFGGMAAHRSVAVACASGTSDITERIAAWIKGVIKAKGLLKCYRDVARVKCLHDETWSSSCWWHRLTSRAVFS